MCHKGTWVYYKAMEPGSQQEKGRVRQKRRTKALLLRAAAELIRRGEVPTVTSVADEADVSRRTAYRYFPSQEQLLAEASLESLRPEVEAIIESARREQDAAEALRRVVGGIQKLAVKHEALLRSILRLSLDRKLGEGTPVRGRRRLDWIQSALETVKPRLSRRTYERLVSALTLTLGVEALVILHDIRGLDSKQSIEVCQWAAGALLEAALREGRKSGRR
ncbi:MAG: TetR family transcriptional regulator [Bryobacteraceae bacterium]|nr:MAG: TetR family transcriptional regulator [Bryobacteraceae bacterium]